MCVQLVRYSDPQTPQCRGPRVNGPIAAGKNFYTIVLRRCRGRGGAYGDFCRGGGQKLKLRHCLQHTAGSVSINDAVIDETL